MPEVVEKLCLAESFVDDSKFFLPFSIDEMEKALGLISCDLCKVAEWCCANYLLISPDKTKSGQDNFWHKAVASATGRRYNILSWQRIVPSTIMYGPRNHI